MNIYVGNLPYSTRDDELERVFGAYGEISSATVIIDRESNRSRGFGFVEMPNGRRGAGGHRRPERLRPRRQDDHRQPGAPPRGAAPPLVGA